MLRSLYDLNEMDGMKYLRSSLIKRLTVSSLLFVGITIVALARDVAPDVPLANASDLRVEQATRAEAIESYHRTWKQSLSVDNSDLYAYADSRAMKHGLSLSSHKGLIYINTFKATFKQLCIDEKLSLSGDK